MAKVYKSFQVRIDPETRLKVPGLPPAIHPPAPKPDREEEEEDHESRELLESFEVPAAGKTGGEAAPAPTAPPPGVRLSAAGTPLPPENESPAEGEAAPRRKGESSVASILKARIEAALETNKRREAELEARAEQLRDWENHLQQRERHLEEEAAKHQQAVQAKLQATDAETNRLLQVARASAENLLNSAHTEAEALKKSAQIESEALKKSITIEIEASRQAAEKEGYALGEERGIAAGEKAGLQEITLEWQNIMQEAETLVNELQTSRMGILKASEEEMVRLVIAMARKVIKVECLSNPEIILQNIDAALNKISGVDKIVMRINMKDKAMSEAHKSEFLNRLSGISELTIVEDGTLTPGGIKIETGVGTVDATIETQAEELERALMRTLKRSE